MRPARPHPRKVAVVSQLRDLISRSKSIAIVDPTGLKVSQISELRRQIKKAGGQLLVVKNTLFKIAHGVGDTKIEGASAYVFSFTDEVSAIKVVAEFAKKTQLPKFKVGFLGHKSLSAAQITQLASLPDKPTLITKMLSSVKAPLFRLTSNLNWNISQLVRTLNAVHQAKTS